MQQVSTDYEYVRQYKKGEERKKILTYLWKKYQPLVKSVVAKHFKYKQTDMDWEDCIHNCFVLFPIVLDKIRITKIKNKKEFSFGCMVKNYLMSYTTRDFKKAFNNYYRNTSVNDHLYEGEDSSRDGISSTIDKFIVSKDNVEEDYLNREFYSEFKDIFKHFYEDCDKDEKKLLRLCIDRNTSYDKQPDKYIKRAVFLKKKKKKNDTITPQFFYQRVSRLQNKFIRYMREYGYYDNVSLASVGLTNLL